MSYFLVDANGYVRDFASIGGLDRLAAWASKQDPVVRAFFDSGTTAAPQQLAHHLGLARSSTFEPVTLEMVDDLIASCKTVTAPLAISDGTSGGDDLRAAIGNGNNQYSHANAPGYVKPASKEAQRRALVKLSHTEQLSKGDPDFRAVPFKQGKDADVEAVERKDAGEPLTQTYNASNPNLRATQDYIEGHKVADIIRNGHSGERPIIANYKGHDYIIDGHHRMAAAKFTGQPIKVDYYKVR